jgi:hypothetical protein
VGRCLRGFRNGADGCEESNGKGRACRGSTPTTQGGAPQGSRTESSPDQVGGEAGQEEADGGCDAKKKLTAPAVAKKAPKKTAVPKRLKKRFKVDGLVKREGNSFDHTKAVHNVLMAAWTDRLMMSSDRARALSTALGIAFSCGLVTTLCGPTFGRQVLITEKGIDFLNCSLGPSAHKALYTKKERAVHGGDVAGASQNHQPNNSDAEGLRG